MRVSVGHGAASSSSVVYQGRGPILAIALDTHEDRIFWYDSEDNEIKAIEMSDDFDKISIHRIITNGLQMVNSMSLDWISNNLYIGDALLHRILVCSVDTDFCASIFTSNVLHVPRSLVVDPLKGKLYWSECGTSRKIESSNLDGSNVRTLAARNNIQCPTSLFIDQPLQTLYWVDPELQLIESVSTNGSNRRNMKSKFIPHPVGLAIFEEDLYVIYLDQSKNKINLAISNKFDFESSHDQMMLKLSEVPSDLQVYHHVLQTPGTSPCQENPCDAGICLPTEQGSFRCACPSGRRLAPNQRGCVWNMSEPSLLAANGNRLLRILPDSVGAASDVLLQTAPQHNVTALAFDSSSQTIFFAETITSGTSHQTALYSFKLNELPEIKTLFEDTGKINDLAVDWISRNIYWANIKQGTVEMSRMDGSSRMVILDNNHIAVPNAIAVDPIEGKLYYADCGSTRHVGACDLDGKNCFVQSIGATAGCVSDMVVDTKGQEMYWTDTTAGQISVTDLKTFKAVEIRHSPEPLSIAMLADHLFWLDSHYGDVLRQPKTDSYHDARIKLSLRPLTSLISLDGDLQPAGSNGCSGAHYGGCSHLCIAKSRMQSSCVCPAHLQLGNDKTSCTPSKESLAPSYSHNPDNYNPPLNRVDQSNERKPINQPVNQHVNQPVHVVIPHDKPSYEPAPQERPTNSFDPHERPLFETIPQQPDRFLPRERPPYEASPSDRSPYDPFPNERPSYNAAPQEPPTYEAAPRPRPSGEETAPRPRPRLTTTTLPPDYYRCPAGQCANEADCDFIFGKYVCICKEGWTGKYCELPEALFIFSSPATAVVSSQSNYSWVGIVFALIIVVIIIFCIAVFCRARSRLRAGETLSFDHIKSSALCCCEEEDSTRIDKLLEPSCSHSTDNIYTGAPGRCDVTDNKRHKPRGKVADSRSS